jgi:hypothetical protein
VIARGCTTSGTRPCQVLRMAWLEAPDTCRGMKGGTKSEAKAKTCTIAAGNEPRVKSKKERKD